MAVLANGLGDRENMRFGESAVQRTPAMATGAEADQLLRVAQVEIAFIVLALEPRRIDQ